MLAAVDRIPDDRAWRGWRTHLPSIGPGIVAGASDADPTTLATHGDRGGYAPRTGTGWHCCSSP